jgi:hypothetical protein
MAATGPDTLSLSCLRKRQALPASQRRATACGTLRSAKAKIVADLHLNKEDGKWNCRFHVDPAFPNRWREEPYYSMIKQVALGGLRGEIFNKRFVTFVSLRGKWTMILPHREVAYECGKIFQFGPDHFEFFKCQDEADTERFQALMAEADAAVLEAAATRPDLAAEGGWDLLEVAWGLRPGLREEILALDRSRTVG